MKSYRNREVVTAYQIAEPGEAVHTRNGVQWAPSGSWAVFGPLGVEIVNDETFVARYAEWENQAEAVEFSPIGKTVETVVEWMEDHPEDVARVQEIEAGTPNPRKGIMSYV